MSSRKLIAVVLSLILAGFSRVAPAEEAREVTDEYLQELDRKLAEKKKQIERMRDEQKRQELAAPLAERVLTQVAEEDYAGATISLEAWGRADPADPRVVPLRALVMQMARERDQKRRTDLLREYLDVMTAPAPAAGEDAASPRGTSSVEPVPPES